MNWAIAAHQNANQQYDSNPYSVHLFLTVQWAKKFIYYIPHNSQEDVINACWLHDTIEDARITYNDILHITNNNKRIADIVFAVTNEKGRNRLERANDVYYKGIVTTEFASFVKLCDRLANAEYSAYTNSKMFKLYQKEYEDFIDKLDLFEKQLYPDMVEELKYILRK